MMGCSKEFSDYNKWQAFDDLHESISRYSASIASRKINWDSLGMVYRTRITENMTENEYFETISELLQEFRDPHIWLIAPTETMYTIDYLGYEKNYDESLTNTYLSDVEMHSPKINSALINGNIGYLFCSDFKGDKKINNDIYDLVINKFSNTKGLIIDLRINNGGSVYNAQNLLNKLADERALWHTTQNRTFNGFDDQFEWFIEPDLNTFYPNKVIVLNGRFTISAGERFAIGAKLLII